MSDADKQPKFWLHLQSDFCVIPDEAIKFLLGSFVDNMLNFLLLPS